MLDASNGNGFAKMYPVTVRIFDINYSDLIAKFFDMNLIKGANDSTAVAMLSSVDRQFKNFKYHGNTG